MNKNSKANRSASSPKDKSLAAYKAWMLEIAKRLTTKNAELHLTEEEWMKNWKEYWREKNSR